MKTKSNNISYINGEFTGVLWGQKALTILKGNDVIYQTIKNRKFDTYEDLVKFVDFIKEGYDLRQKHNAETSSN